MLTLETPAPVNVFAGVIAADGCDPDGALMDAMQARWGDAYIRFGPVPFDRTDYYRPEMGSGLRRFFAGFALLRLPDCLAQLKLEANEIEEAFLDTRKRRTVNVDIGYIDFHKVVLASTKPGPTKIYLGKGIWADMTLRYTSGHFEAFPWTFPDFAGGRYDEFFHSLRDRYKAALRHGAPALH